MNPYQPPDATALTPAADSSPKFLASLTPATLAIALALLIWVVLVSILDRVVAQRFSMPTWSFTLFLATSLAILAISRAWRTATDPFAYACVFAIFCVVFLVVEGDVSNGTDYWNMAIVYGTLLFLPIATYTLARYLGRKRRDILPAQDGG